MSLHWDTDIQYLKGVGPKLGSMLKKAGIGTIGKMLEFYPRAYEDRRAARSIATLNEGDLVSLRAQIINISSYGLGRSSRKIFDILIRDASGQIHCKFFRVPYKGYFDRFQVGQMVRVIGKITTYRGKKEFHHPDLREDVEDENQDQLIPIYIETEGISSAKFSKMIRSALSHPEFKAELSQIEKLPLALRQKYDLHDREKALIEIHVPQPEEADAFHKFRARSQIRLIFEEFFWLELFLALKKSGFEKEKSHPVLSSGKLFEKLIQSLPFAPTKAQLRCYSEIVGDLKSSHPMHRLVQGDVGSGKTLVVFFSILFVAEEKKQSCLMVPTEILAEQHFKSAQKMLVPLGLKVELLTGQTKTAERRRILEGLNSGECDLVIGTHALIEDEVQFQDLSLVVIDEQHRFGVEQRSRLKSKGFSPNFLILTATPIPRTLAMTAYGDLDVSIIDELPPGRSPIQTRVAYESKRPQVLEFMQAQVAKGRQAYIIYPLVEESEKIDLKNAVEEYEKLRSSIPSINFGLLHGKMKSEEKDAVMQKFRAGEVQVLVSTTVIEVGVDVPNANLMIIEHAERFGLSQLHQLRGRVGRGEHKSFCILSLGYAVSEEARRRTEFMETTNDGFKVAEFDLELRGPGEFLGTRQSGLPGFKLANLVRDTELLMRARQAAFEVFEKDPQLKLLENQKLREELLKAHGATALAGVG